MRLAWALAAVVCPVLAQSTPPQSGTESSPAAAAPVATPAPAAHGTVLFDSNRQAPAPALADESQAAADATADPAAKLPAISDEARGALAFSAYDLDLHLEPERSALVMHARVTVRNDGALPLAVLALQISSSLHWEQISVSGRAVPFVQHRLATDADHTGFAQEALLTLPQPLAPGATLQLAAFYAGTVSPASQRLQALGAPAEQAAYADWDEVSAEFTGLRGFGSVLWYPVAAPPYQLGDGAALFRAVGRMRLRNAAATVRLHLTLAYRGEAPDAAYFCGQRQPLQHVSEAEDLPVAQAPGLATAEFGPSTLGFRDLSLFVAESPATPAGPLLSVETAQQDALPLYAATAARVMPVLQQWLGQEPLSSLQLIDHAGQPYQDGTLLVAPLATRDSGELAQGLIQALTPAWFRSPQPWLQQGVAQFLALLWLEHTDGRDAAMELLQHQANTLALAEPASAPAPDAPGQSLLRATDEVYYRNKAAAVLWMLRGIVGDEALQQALQQYRLRGPRSQEPELFEKVLEELTHRDLHWFFNDWVNRDRGLPDLRIVNIVLHDLPASIGKPGGTLVAVEVENTGDAVAEVPVVVRTGTLTASTRLRIAGRSRATTRIVFEADPDEVIVNDGSVPEQTSGVHVQHIQVRKGGHATEP
ncbi:MAG: hypothetical protein KGK08_02105 [Acidobacteriota bacterium]|nr:hypothetical protein [Acidobacteriota bacterium]